MKVDIESVVNVTDIPPEANYNPGVVELLIKRKRAEQNEALKEYVEELLIHGDAVKAYDLAKKII